MKVIDLIKWLDQFPDDTYVTLLNVPGQPEIYTTDIEVKYIEKGPWSPTSKGFVCDISYPFLEEGFIVINIK